MQLSKKFEKDNPIKVDLKPCQIKTEKFASIIAGYLKFLYL